MLRTGRIQWFLAAALAVSGCTSGDSPYSEVDPTESEVADSDHGHHHDHDHDHGHEGPHGGTIVELGTEEVHAELVADESKHRLDIYILGSDASTARPIAASEISLSFKHGDEVEEFKLTATSQDGDADGQSSLFSLTSEEALDELHEHSEGATITVTVGEKTYSGVATHADHHEHAHDAHDDDEKHADHPRDEDTGKEDDDQQDGKVLPNEDSQEQQATSESETER